MEMVTVRHEFEDGAFVVKVRVRIMGKSSLLWKYPSIKVPSLLRKGGESR